MHTIHNFFIHSSVVRWICLENPQIKGEILREIKKYFELNKNENMYLCSAAKVMSGSGGVWMLPVGKEAGSGQRERSEGQGPAAQV